MVDRLSRKRNALFIIVILVCLQILLSGRDIIETYPIILVSLVPGIIYGIIEVYLGKLDSMIKYSKGSSSEIVELNNLTKKRLKTQAILVTAYLLLTSLFIFSPLNQGGLASLFVALIAINVLINTILGINIVKYFFFR